MNELLGSLSEQKRNDFEVLIVEDGSTNRCDVIAAKFQSFFPIKYYFKQNEGPGIARNYGYRHAKGEYLVAFDSDCIVPRGYFNAVDDALAASHFDAWGGPDMPHESFTPVQRAMGYTMSSFLTTGGIRGGKKQVGWFQPRSFNIGMSRRVFEATGGFSAMRVAEDIDLSIRIRDLGFKIGLIDDAFVYHKRRTDFYRFFKQVYAFGQGRARIGALHRGGVKLTHWFPGIFTISLLTSFLLLPFISIPLFTIAGIFFTIYFSAIFIHSFAVNRNFLVAFLSIPSALIQLAGYGLGFLSEFIKIIPGRVSQTWCF